MADIDPALLAKLQQQGWLPQQGQTLPPAAPEPSKIQGAHEAPTSHEAAVRGAITAPITPMPQPGGATPAPSGARGVFADAAGGATSPEAAWTPPKPQATGGVQSVVSPETRRLFNNATVAEQTAAHDIGTAQEQSGQQTAAGLDKQASELGALNLAQEQQRQVRNKALDFQAEQYKKATEEAAQDRIDPQHGWTSKSAASKVMGLIGVILGGFSAAQGKGNPALEILQKQISDDIDAQKANIAQRGKRAEGMRNLYEMNLAHFRDEGAADLATQGQLLQRFKLQGEAQAARNGSALGKANMKMTLAQIDQKQAEIHKSLEHWTQGQSATAVTKEDAARAAAFVEKGVPPDKALQLAMAVAGKAPMPKGAGIPLKGGKSTGDGGASLLGISGTPAPQALSVGEQIESSLGNAPLVGRLFQGTEGYKKGLANETANIGPHFFAHKVGGLRNPEAQEKVLGALIVKPGDSDSTVAEKNRLRALVEASAQRAGGSQMQFSSDRDEE